MAARNLRAVPPGAEVARKSTAKTVAEAIAGGDRRDILVATRNRIAKTVDDPTCPPRDLAALTRRLDDIVDKIAALDAAAAQEAAESASVDDEAFDAEAL